MSSLRNEVIQAFTNMMNDSIFKVLSMIEELKSKVALNFKNDRALQACVSGTISLEITKADDPNVPIGTPNGAAAGTLKVKLCLLVKDSKGEVVGVLDGIAPTITPGKTGVGFSDPTISPASPVITKGRCLFDLVYATDVGVTEVYAVADTVKCDIDLTVCGNALTQVTYTDTMVA
jgi:hypothetical protein